MKTLNGKLTAFALKRPDIYRINSSIQLRFMARCLPNKDWGPRSKSLFAWPTSLCIIFSAFCCPQHSTYAANGLTLLSNGYVCMLLEICDWNKLFWDWQYRLYTSCFSVNSLHEFRGILIEKLFTKIIALSII